MPTTMFSNVHNDYSNETASSNSFSNLVAWISKKVKAHREEMTNIDAAMDEHLKKYPHEQNSLQITCLLVEATNATGRHSNNIRSQAVAPQIFPNPHTKSLACSYEERDSKNISADSTPVKHNSKASNGPQFFTPNKDVTPSIQKTQKNDGNNKVHLSKM